MKLPHPDSKLLDRGRRVVVAHLVPSVPRSPCKAKLVCVACPVRTECLAEALDNRIEFGVWGGMTERERRALLRRRPDVTSWRELLEDARRQHIEEDVRVG